MVPGSLSRQIVKSHGGTLYTGRFSQVLVGCLPCCVYWQIWSRLLLAQQPPCRRSCYAKQRWAKMEPAIIWHNPALVPYAQFGPIILSQRHPLKLWGPTHGQPASGVERPAGSNIGVSLLMDITAAPCGANETLLGKLYAVFPWRHCEEASVGQVLLGAQPSILQAAPP